MTDPFNYNDESTAFVEFCGDPTDPGCQTRVLVRQPALILNQSELPIPEVAESSLFAVSASYAQSSSVANTATTASFAVSASYLTQELLFGDLVNVWYVTPEGNDTTNDGKTLGTAYRTVKKASSASIALYSASAAPKPRMTIRVSPGTYEEVAPIIIPPFTSIVGNDLRTSVIRPTSATRTQNLFLMNNGTYAYGLRLEGCEINDLRDPRTGFYFAFQPGAFIVTSPYIQNCTSANVPADKFYVPLDYVGPPSPGQPNPAVGNGPGGMIVDDSVLDGYSPLKSMIVDAYTQVAFNGMGLVVRGEGYAQQVSFFTNFSHVGVWAIGGGHASLLNSNTTFGDYGLRSSGVRIIVVADVSGIPTASDSAAASILLSEKANIQNNMITRLQGSGSYSSSYSDPGSFVYTSTIKDSGIFIDSIASDLLGAPGRIANFTQALFKAQDLSSGSIYTLPTASGFTQGAIATFRVNDLTRYTESSASRDTTHILDALTTDLLYGGNERSVQAGKFFHIYPSPAITTQLQKTLEGIRYVGDLATEFSINSTQSSSIASNLATILDIVENGTGSAPPVVLNSQDNIKFTNTAQITSASSATATELTKLGTLTNILVDIITNGTGSLPATTQNVSDGIKVTNLSTITSASSASGTEVTKVSSSFVTIVDIIQRGPGVAPASINNVTENIKFTAEPQFISGVITASAADITSISSSIALVTRIIQNGTGSLPTLIPYTTPSSDPNTIAAYNLLKGNIEFIKKETIAYISSSWSTASYDQSKCERDIGYIVSGAAEDLLYGSNSASIANGKFYYEIPSQATGDQVLFTVDAVKYVNRLAQKVVRNIEFTTGSIQRRAAWDLITENIDFIKEETIAYISSSWSTASYNQETCKRDIGYLLDAVKTDLYYGGNERSIVAGTFYHTYPAALPAITDQLYFTVDAINYASRLTQKIIQNESFTNASIERQATWNLLRSNKTLFQEEVIAYISASWSAADYNQNVCKRDIIYLVDALATDILYGGNERTIYTGVFYQKAPTAAAAITDQLSFTVDAIEYLGQLTKLISSNTVLVAKDSTKFAGYTAIRNQRVFIRDKTIDLLNDGMVYDFMRAWRYIKEYIINDPDGRFGAISLATKSKIEQLINVPLNTVQSVVVNLEPTYLQVFGSLITSTSHDFSYAGSGVNFLALPPNQRGIGKTNFDIRVFQEGGGRVYHTSGDETGDFFAGNDFIIRQETGTIDGRTFNKALLARVTPLQLALENL